MGKINTDPMVTFLVCTCDDYEDSWNPLFTLIKKYWEGFDLQVVLNTETKSYQHDGFNILAPQLFNTHQNPKQVAWSERLKKTIVEAVNTEFILLFLDDFYLLSKVDTDKLDQCLDIMIENPNIANIQLFPPPTPNNPFKDYEWLVVRKKYAPYYINLQAGLWRKADLLKFLRPHENPWYFERWGSIRVSRYSKIVLALNPLLKNNAIFNYNPLKHGLTDGKWRYDTIKLFKKENISFNYSKRGVFSNKDIISHSKRNYVNSFINICKSLWPW